MQYGNIHAGAGSGNVNEGVRFGRTMVLTRCGNPIEQQVEAIACAANRRGVMGVGVAGAIRLAGGAEIERQIMACAPLTTGTAYLTGSGTLGASGIRYIIHAVVADALGAPPRVDSIRRGTSAVLSQADRVGVRSLLLPPFGAGHGSGAFSASQVWWVMIAEIIAHVRRFHSRIEQIILLCRDEREALQTRESLREARVLWLEHPV